MACSGHAGIDPDQCRCNCLRLRRMVIYGGFRRRSISARSASTATSTRPPPRLPVQSRITRSALSPRTPGRRSGRAWVDPLAEIACTGRSAEMSPSSLTKASGRSLASATVAGDRSGDRSAAIRPIAVIRMSSGRPQSPNAVALAASPAGSGLHRPPPARAEGSGRCLYLDLFLRLLRFCRFRQRDRQHAL